MVAFSSTGHAWKTIGKPEENLRKMLIEARKMGDFIGFIDNKMMFHLG
jgi:hypothetical protein